MLVLKSRVEHTVRTYHKVKAVKCQPYVQTQPAVRSIMCGSQPGGNSVPVVQQHQQRFGCCAGCRVVRAQLQHVLQRHHYASIPECSLHVSDNSASALAHALSETDTGQHGPQMSRDRWG